MKLSHSILFISFIFQIHSLFAQIPVPKDLNLSNANSDTVKISEVIERYNLLRENTDSSFISVRKQLDRWAYNVFPRLKIENDSTYSLKAYQEAFKTILNTDLYCDKDDKSKWTNIGPRYVGQQNGQVTAVHVNPSNLDEMLIGMERAGIFRSEDHGQTWVCVSDALPFPVIGVEHIFYDPNNYDRLIAVVGNYSGLDAVQEGYLTSDDGGENWTIGNDDLGGGVKMAKITNMSFFSSTAGLAFATTEKQIVYSTNSGASWNTIPLPIEYTSAMKFNRLVISGNNIEVIASAIGQKFYYWRGLIVQNGNNYSITWEAENAAQFLPPDAFEMQISDNNPLSSGDFTNGNHIQVEPGVYHHIPINGCGYNVPNSSNVGRWPIIFTPGWFTQDFNGVDRISCTNSFNFDREIFTHRLYSNVVERTSSESTIHVKCEIPEGARLKICISPYRHGSSSPNAPSPNSYSFCLLMKYDYQTIFEQEIYVSDWAIGGTMSVVYDGFIDMSALDINPTIDPAIYFIVEFNNDYNVGEEFTLEEFDITSDKRPNYLNLTERELGRSYCQAEYNSLTSVFKTTNNGGSYSLINQPNSSLRLEGGIPNKDLFIASKNDPNMFYHGAVKNVHQFIENGTDITFRSSAIGGSGYHDDFRTDQILSLGQTDYILTGNDGGVAEIVNANLASPEITSLNGDLVGSMIYNFDIDEASNTVLIGLQDNGSKHFTEQLNGMTSVGGGDGCVAMVRQDDPSQFVIGDPQGGGAGALKDAPLLAGIVDDSPDIYTGEAYLGMRLEEYRFGQHKFIAGLKRIDNGDPWASVIVNRQANVTDKVMVPGSKHIGAIAISDRNSTTAYLAEGFWRGTDEPGPALYKTTDDSYTWNPLNPVLTFEDNSTANLNEILIWDYVNALAVDHMNADLFYVGMSGVADKNGVVTHEYFRVLRSEDGGANLVDWSKGLPALPVNYLLSIESKNHLVFCGNDVGVYYRMDGMDRWECFSNDLPKMRITDLNYNYCTGELYASTYGRGMWKSPVNLDLGDAYVHEDITTNTTWSTDRGIRGDIRIRTGQTLTITATGTIHMDANRKIIVEPGAKLIVDGGTITNRCNAYWDGIEVMGNSALTQNATNQGMVITKNNATIEYAVKAIKTWKTDQWNTTGGIVDVSNTTFKNNKVSIFFYPYNNVLPSGFEPVNIGTVKNCNFLWNDDFIGIRPKSAIILYNVNGVTIQGCDFRDDRTSIVGEDERAAGIFSLDANFRVMARPTSLPLAVHNEFGTGGGYDVNNFINLEDGVVIMGVNSVRAPIVDHCNFNNVKQPLQILANDNSIITRNLVDFNTQHPADIQSSQGFQLANSSGYHIEGNTFVSNAAGVFKGGILSWDSGSEHNLLYRNYFNNQSIGLYAQGINSNTSPQVINFGNFKGLYWKCNELSNGQFDLANFVIPGVYGQGVRLAQGGSNEPAGNYFSNPSLVDVQLRHTDGYDMRYFYSASQNANVLEQPTVVDPNVDPIEILFDRNCLSKLNTQLRLDNRPLVAASSLGTITTAHESLSSDLETHRATLADGLASGDAETVHTLVATMNEDPAYALIKLNDLTPYLSASVLEEVGAFVPDFVSYTDYFTLIVDNIEATRTPALRVFLDGLAWDATYADSLRQAMKTGITSRGSLEQTIMRDEAELEVLNNWLVMHSMSDTLVDWTVVREQLTTRNNADVLSQLIDEHIGHGLLSESVVLLDSLDAIIPSLTLSTEQLEMEDFSLFKRYLLTVVDEEGILRSVPDSVMEHLQYFADSLTGKAARQAQNLLCFHRGMCTELEVQMPITIKSMTQISNEDPARFYRLPKLKAIPNPSAGEFQLEVPEGCVIAELTICDIQGRAVSFVQNEQKDNRAKIELNALQNGVVIVTAKCTDGPSYSTRLVINN